MLYCVFQGSANHSNLWYATYAGQTYWTDRGQIKTLAAGQTGNDLTEIVGSQDTPALVVYDNKLLCIHRGGNRSNDSGYLWSTQATGSPDDESSKQSGFWSTDAQLKTKDSGNVGALGAPRLVDYNNQLYCVHPGGGNSNDRGYLWDTTTQSKGTPAPAPSPKTDPVWVEAHGAGEQTSQRFFPSSYLYYELDDVAAEGQALSVSKTIPDVGRNASTPFLLAVLSTDSDHVDFPTGAKLTITGPDGKTFGSALNDNQQVVILQGEALRGLIIKTPQPGNYKVDLTVPKGTRFQFEFETFPEGNVATTIEDALSAAYQQWASSQHLTKRGVQDAKDETVMLEIGLAVVARLWQMEMDQHTYYYVLENLIENLTGPGLRPSPTPTSSGSATSTPLSTLTATLSATLTNPSPSPSVTGTPAPTPTPVATGPQRFSVNFQDGRGVLHYETYRDFIAAIRGRFGLGRFAVRLDVLENGQTVWLRMEGRDFYVTAVNLSAEDSASDLNSSGWSEFTEEELRYPETSPAQISPSSIDGAMRLLRSGARATALTSTTALVITAFVLAEAPRFAIIENIVDAALNFEVGTTAQNAVRWNDYSALLRDWSNISERVFQVTTQANISMLTVWLWATNNGPFAGLVNGRQNQTTGTFFEGLYNLLQSLGYHAEAMTTPTPTSTAPATPPPSARK